MRSIIAAVAVCLAIPALAEGVMPEETPTLSFERVFASPDLNGESPRSAKLSPDGRYLTLLRNRADDTERYDLWAFDRQRKEWAMLVDSEKLGSGRELSEEEKMQRERGRIGNLKGIVSYQWSSDGEALLVPLDGDLYLAKLDGTIIRLTDTKETELNAALSSKGGFVSFVRGRQLWVGEIGGEAAPITPLESNKDVRWGEAEFIAQEEMRRNQGFWWSPDDQRIVVERFDESGVEIARRAAIGADGTRIFEQRYPFAGTPNAVVSLFVMNPDGSERVEIDLGDNDDIYIPAVDWAPDGKAIYVHRQNRDQTVLDILKVDPATGSSEVLFTEKAAISDYWLNLGSDYRWLKDGSLIWWSERDGFGHLYRFADGEWTQLTSGEWVVTGLVGVDQAAGRLYFTGTKDDVLAQQIYALDVAEPGAITLISDPAFVHSASMDGKGQTLLVTRSNDDTPPQSYLADSAGNRIAWVMENALDEDHPYSRYLAGHRPTQYGTIKAEDGTDLYWEMVTPELEPGKRYPVFYHHYAGPGPQKVSKNWDGAERQAIVDKGYIWFVLDNRGSANRGVAFEQPIYRRMGGVEVRDQKAGAQFLKTLDFVDPDKIALDGGSYGGYMTIKQLQADPGLYAAGIAAAPVTRWELYDTHWTERYMGTPQGNPEGYASASAVKDATKISDALLLIHGMSDDNVVLDHTTELVAAMQAANVPFEMMLYPGFGHAIRGQNISPHLMNAKFRFLEANGVTPPE
ncbi:S9 family peptidase [Erythrobacter sp.]|uniref:S9 family peptidase n=1 Tax=Erythrobacter sp. TaxID=1042 RepID=UPI0025F6FA98|nr:S9 family peptidase [Erythrobacter sp.]